LNLILCGILYADFFLNQIGQPEFFDEEISSTNGTSIACTEALVNARTMWASTIPISTTARRTRKKLFMDIIMD
jgi:hypothetical protein